MSAQKWRFRDHEKRTGLRTRATASAVLGEDRQYRTGRMELSRSDLVCQPVVV